jgi:hypothetical protein
VVYLVGLVKCSGSARSCWTPDGLRVRAGFLIDVAVPIERIAQVTMAIDGAEIRDPATLNAALLAWPNVVVHLARCPMAWPGAGACASAWRSGWTIPNRSCACCAGA